METKPPEQSFGELSLHYLDLLSVFLLHAVSFTDIYALWRGQRYTRVYYDDKLDQTCCVRIDVCCYVFAGIPD